MKSFHRSLGSIKLTDLQITRQTNYSQNSSRNIRYYGRSKKTEAADLSQAS
ncbi:hypothetical protein T12_4127 [Trichinella patagoniensis]|uniref:Uncharacterized protein n=1 Tax=Trichinella patagoniensis TaxID=990121 RepID=A0A0V0YTV1_9BILA|nr:hypothetical protein T12_4127 [Trichinella patagoniensis]